MMTLCARRAAQVGAFALVCLAGVGGAWATPPVPAKADIGGHVEGKGFAAAVYTVDEPGQKEPRRNTYLELFTRAGASYKSANKLRVSSDIGEESDYKLEVINLKTGRSVIRFRSTANKDSDIGRDGYLAVFSGRAPFRAIYAGSVDAFEPRERIDIEDVDGDGTLELVWAQVDAGVLFCGRSHARLFPRIWDFKTEQFVQAPLRQAIARDAPTVTAVLTTDAPMGSHFPELVSFRSASSDHRDTHARIPLEIGDGNASTAWIEGARGWGRGEFVTADVNRAFALKGMRILPGHTEDLDTYARHGIPQSVLLSFDDGSFLKVELPKTPLVHLKEKGGLYVAFPKPVTSRCVTMTLLDTRVAQRPGPHQRAAISELTPLIELDYVARSEAISQLIEGLATEKEKRRRHALLALANGLGPEIARSLEAIILKDLTETSSTDRLSRLIPLIGLLPLAEGSSLLKTLLSHEPLSRSELALVQRMVSFEGKIYVDALIKLSLDDTAPPFVRERAVRIVGRAGHPRQMAELIPMLGQGDGDLRRSVVRGISRAPIIIAEPLLAVIDNHPDSNTAHDALWALDRITRKSMHGSTGPLPGGERIMKAYNATEDVQIRLRAIRLMTRVTASNADVFLITVLESNERPEIRLMAAEALSIYLSPKSTRSLTKALSDESPAVRFQAIRSLRTRPNLPEVVDAVIAYARRETWKRGLTWAFRLLATSGQREGADFLYKAIVGDDEPKALMALTAITKAQRNVRAQSLARIIRDDVRSLRARQEALQALAYGTDPASEHLLIEVLRAGDYPEELQATAARSMGIRRSPRTLEALIETLTRSGRPNIQRACIRSLAFYASVEAHTALVGLRSKVDLRTRKYLEESIEAITERLRDKKN